MNEREKLLQRISSTQFASWELHIYLDTHPCDRTANDMYKKYTAEAKILTDEYQSKYGPLYCTDSENADWLNDPWPWENEEGVC